MGPPSAPVTSCLSRWSRNCLPSHISIVGLPASATLRCDRRRLRRPMPWPRSHACRKSSSCVSRWAIVLCEHSKKAAASSYVQPSAASFVSSDRLISIFGRPVAMSIITRQWPDAVFSPGSEPRLRRWRTAFTGMPKAAAASLTFRPCFSGRTPHFLDLVECPPVHRRLLPRRYPRTFQKSRRPRVLLNCIAAHALRS